jgi:NAD(P)-dependent dehydrogenase (short-subunit alcohol dehydrogenase family)
MTDTLKGKRILLTGASRGVGLASARLLLKNGAEILGVAQNADRLARAEKELSHLGSFTSLCVELTEPDAAKIITEAVRQRWQALDIVIHNAGVQLHHEGGILAEPDGILERSMDIHVMAPFRITRSLLPLLKLGQEPTVINVGSGAGTLSAMTEPGIASYRLSKWTESGLTMLQANELAGVVCVNAFDPGWVRTDLGGPRAPGTPEEAAEGLLKTLLVPWTESGHFYKDGEKIPW